jgi:MYXO-CTERM domain-containing protein
MSIFIKRSKGLVAAAAAAMSVSGAADAAEKVTTVNWTRPASTGELYISFNIVAGVGQNPTSSSTANTGWDIKVRSSGGQFIIEPYTPATPGASSYWGVMQYPGSSGNAGNLPNGTQVYSNQSFSDLGGPVTFGSAQGQWKLNTTSDALNGFGFKFKNNNAGVNQSHFGYMTLEFGATVDSWRIKKIAYEDAFGAAIVVEGTYAPPVPAPGVLPLLAAAGIAARRRRR